ncbi:MAG TPA: PilZ domain-containing protein, partial [Candidatus Acidoferrum sp.]
MITSAAAHKHDWTNERRSCSRESLNWIVLVFFGQNNWGKLIDLSEKGMCFQFEQPPSLRESIEFTFEAMGCMSIPHEGNVFGDSFQAAGRVVWTHEFERTAGVQFLNLSQRSRDQIRYWLSSATGQAAAPHQEAAVIGHTAGLTEELKREWDAEWDRRTGQQAPEALAPRVAPPASPKAPAEPILETAELKMEELDSHLESLWQRESTFSPQPLPGQSVFPRDPVEEPGAESPETAGFSSDSLRELEDEFVTENPAPLPHDTQSFWRSNPEIAPQNLETQPVEADMVRAARAYERLEQSGFEAPPMLEPEEQPRQGVTLRTKPQRARVGYVIAVTCLGTLLVAATVIAIANKSTGKAGAGEVASVPPENRVDATSEERGAVESSAPFLVEVLDSSSRRSVLWFSGDSHQDASTREGQKAAPTLSAVSASSGGAIAEERPPLAANREPGLDFTLASPHPASGPNKSPSASNSEAPVAPTIGEAPATADMPLHENLPSPAAPVEATLPQGGQVQPARLIRAVLPAYPQLAKSNRVAGDVTLDALIDASGNVRDVAVI